jgi:1-deoxy-D-xylulose-5-phosphate reductoisomerase
MTSTENITEAIAKKRTVTILGVTGSIGRQTLDVIEKDRDSFELVLITCNKDIKSLIEIADKWNIKTIGLHSNINKTEKPLDREVLSGNKEISNWICERKIDTLVLCTSGIEAFEILRDCYSSFKRICISSKEIIVMAGLCGLLDTIKSKILLMPVDSEHVAIHQLIEKTSLRDIKRLIITASGGPIYSKANIDDDISWVTKEEALKHPTWKMGEKVTIDSATLVNKGIEIMEAKYLFGIPESKIDVVIHPESIIHSLVELNDGFVFASLAIPDMRLPIQYSLYYPDKMASEISKSLNFFDIKELSFRNTDPKKIKSIKLAYEALNNGNIYPLAYVASDEVAVEEFLNGKITFKDIYKLISETLNEIKPFNNISPYNIMDIYLEIKRKSRKILEKI